MNSNSKICPLCYSEIKETDETVICEKCGAPHHSDCWQLNGGCGNKQCGFKVKCSSQSAENNGTPLYNAQSSCSANQTYTPSDQNAKTYTQQNYNTSSTYQQSPYNNPNNTQEKYPSYNDIYKHKNNGNGKKIAVICLAAIGLIAIIVLILTSVKGFANSVKQENHYTIGINAIPSIKNVLGERDLTGVSTTTSGGVTQKQYKYTNKGNAHLDVMNYSHYLIQYNGFKYNTNDYNDNSNALTAAGSCEIGAKAGENGKIIVLDMQWDNDTYTITVSLREGSLSDI